MLHLHRFEHDQQLPLRHRVAGLHRDLHDFSGHRRGHRALSLPVRRRRAGGQGRGHCEMQPHRRTLIGDYDAVRRDDCPPARPAFAVMHDDALGVGFEADVALEIPAEAPRVVAAPDAGGDH